MEPERIMIATWSDNKRELLVNLLSPVKVVSALEKENEWEVVVSSDKASLSLENGGRNLRKISEFLGKKIHISKLSELQKKKNVVIVWNGNIDIEGRRR
jgi:transcription antitermination factor NusA-like protein